MKEPGAANLKPVFAVSVFVLITVVLSVFLQKSETGTIVYAPADAAAYEAEAKRDLLALLLAYPDHIAGFEKTKDGTILVVMQSGKKIVYDDRKVKNYEQKLYNADLQDSMEQIYPLRGIEEIPKENFDPGRIRNYAFLHEVYGNTQGAIEKDLVRADTGQGSVSFNKNNGAADALQNAFQGINELLERSKSVYGFVFPINGTFNYRVIAGTNRLSPHAFGIAIDLRSDPRDYWRWASKEQGQKRLEEYPPELVRIFEENGFVWGGKWNHFDFLHYEYRPEIILKARACDESGKMTDPWYSGFPETEESQNCIETVEWIFE